MLYNTDAQTIAAGGTLTLPANSINSTGSITASGTTGVTLAPGQYLVTFVSDEWGTEYMHLFTADGFEGEIRTCDEGELEWIDRKKLCDLTLWEGDKIFLRLLENDDEPFFLLKLGYDGDELVSAVLNGTKIV